MTLRRGMGNRRNPNTKDKAAEIARQDRRAKVLTLTVDGFTCRQIATMLGISKSRVHDDWKRAVADRSAVSKEQSRAVATERLEAIVKANMPDVKGERGIARRKGSAVVMAAISLDARINGYGAPKTIEVTGKGGGPIQYEELQAMTNEQLATLAAGAWPSVRGADGGSGAGAATPAPNSEPDGLRPDPESAPGGADAPGADREGPGEGGDGAG